MLNYKYNLNKYKNWLENKNLAHSTINLYSRVIKNYQNKALNTSNISQIIKQGLNKHEPSYLVLTREILKSYTQFKKIGKINWEKINKIIPQLAKKFFATLNESELEQIKSIQIEKSQQIYQRNNLILDFLFYTGIRVNELVNLKHSDWENNSLKIVGKGNKVRYVFLPPFLLEKINPYSQDYLFTTSKGNRLWAEYIRQIIRTRVKKAGIKKRITPHTFRRSFATLLNSKGSKLTTIQKLLGHSQLQTTASYIHNSYEELYADYSKLWKNEINSASSPL